VNWGAIKTVRREDLLGDVWGGTENMSMELWEKTIEVCSEVARMKFSIICWYPPYTFLSWGRGGERAGGEETIGPDSRARSAACFRLENKLGSGRKEEENVWESRQRKAGGGVSIRSRLV